MINDGFVKLLKNSVLQSVVLDQGTDHDLLAEIQKHLEDLFNSGLRSRLVSLIKVRITLPSLFSITILISFG